MLWRLALCWGGEESCLGFKNTMFGTFNCRPWIGFDAVVWSGALLLAFMLIIWANKGGYEFGRPPSKGTVRILPRSPKLASGLAAHFSPRSLEKFQWRRRINGTPGQVPSHWTACGFRSKRESVCLLSRKRTPPSPFEFDHGNKTALYPPPPSFHGCFWQQRGRKSTATNYYPND
jgi:hypothetical protein